MSQLNEDKWERYRRAEKIVSNVEKDQAKLNEALQKKSYHIGPANDLLRFMYILEKQNENDSDEIRAKTREQVMDYFESNRVPDEPEKEEEEEKEEEATATQADDQPVNPPLQLQFTSNSQTPVVVSQPSIQIPVASTVYQPIHQPVNNTVPQPVHQLVNSTVHQPVASGTRLSPVTNPRNITPTKLQSFEVFLAKAHQYEQRYKQIGMPRKKELASRLREIINKLRTDTFVTLTDELFRYLNGEQQKVGTIMVRISNNDERLLCLSMLTNLILRQLLGSDLTDIKTEVFLPLITKCSANPQQQEFSTIFLEHLHKKCPYTVPYYPEQDPNMTNEQYLQTLGYIKKPEGGQERLETDSEFFNRMSGFIRLFCKLLVSRGPPFDSSLSYAWEWFSDVLNLPPRANITAILIRVFLDEAGEKMINEYGKQFSKIIDAVHKYLPRLQKDTSSDQITRLQLTLNNLQK